MRDCGQGFSRGTSSFPIQLSRFKFASQPCLQMVSRIRRMGDPGSVDPLEDAIINAMWKPGRPKMKPRQPSARQRQNHFVILVRKIGFGLLLSRNNHVSFISVKTDR